MGELQDAIELEKLNTFFYKIVYDVRKIIVIIYDKGHIGTKHNLKEFITFDELSNFIYKENLYVKEETFIDYKSLETQVENAKDKLFKFDD